MDYIVNSHLVIECGFKVNGNNIESAVGHTNHVLSTLPSTLYSCIDYKTTSAMIGAVFCDFLATEVGGIVNPIEKGHPDIIPVEGKNCSEEKLRNYPQGIEVKCTVGNVTSGANLRAGQTRINALTSITWQAHHREVTELMGLVWDFVDSGHTFNYPTITAVFYAGDLISDDWGAISGITGRNTKVTGMKASGKFKMGAGWLILLNREDYINSYTSLLNFQLPH